MKPILALALFALAAPAFAQDYMPPDSGRFDVAAYGGIPNDGQPDDAAFAAALAAIHARGTAEGILYFGPGVWDFNGALESRTPSGAWFAYVNLTCAGRDVTTLRLKNGAAGFGDSNNPKAFVHQASENDGHSSWGTQGGGGSGFENWINDCTVDLGNNPGAIGSPLNMSNDAGMNRVRFTGTSCRAGIWMFRGAPGPAHIHDVTVEGCDYGLLVEKNAYSSLTFSGLHFLHQHVLALWNQGNAIQVDGMTSDQTTPDVQAVVNSGSTAQMVLLDATLSGVSSTLPAVTNSGDAKGYYRNLNATGYPRALDSVAGGSISERATHAWIGAQTGSIRLPIALPPDTPQTNPADFVSIVQFGALPKAQCGTCDNAGAWQAAIDSGAKVIYCPTGNWPMHSTVTVRGAAVKLRGYGCDLTKNGTFSGPVFAVAAGSSPVVTLEGLDIEGKFTGPGPQPPATIQHNARDLVLRRMQGVVYESGPGAGKAWADTFVGLARVHGNAFTAWNFDAEFPGLHLLADGPAKVAVIGLKTEGAGRLTDTGSGASVEVLGGYMLPTGPLDGAVPFVAVDGNHSILMATTPDPLDPNRWANFVSETHGASTTLFPKGVFLPRGSGRTVFYADWAPQCTGPAQILPGSLRSAQGTGAALTIAGLTVPAEPCVAIVEIVNETSRGAARVTAMTRGAQAFTLAGQALSTDGLLRTELWVLPVATQGTADVAVTFDKASAATQAQAFVLAGVRPQGPVPVAVAGGSATPFETTLTTTAPNQMLVDAFGEGLGEGGFPVPTQGAQQLIGRNIGTQASVAGSWRSALTPGPYPLGWSRPPEGGNRVAQVIGAFEMCPQ